MTGAEAPRPPFKPGSRTLRGTAKPNPGLPDHCLSSGAVFAPAGTLSAATILQTAPFSLAKGFLAGKYRAEVDLSKSVRGQGAKAYLNERGYRILAALDQVAQEHRSTPARVALAWLIARPSITAPIASATSQPATAARPTG